MGGKVLMWSGGGAKKFGDVALSAPKNKPIEKDEKIGVVKGPSSAGLEFLLGSRIGFTFLTKKGNIKFDQVSQC